MSCNSSFSDCSLPCHELVTYSEQCEPLPEGLVRVSVRPPQSIEPCVYCGPCGPCLCVPCADRDHYDIKFVSHIVDRPHRAKICKIIPPFIPPPPSIPSLEIPSLPSPPSPVKIIPPAPPSIVPSISEETISVPTIISEPPPIIEEIPSPPPPPPPPVISIPSVVEPGVIGVSGTQVVTRSRKHYGDLCKLIRCSKPCRPCCPPCPPPCDLPPSPCESCIPYEPCDHSVPCYPCDNDNQSNSCSSYPPCEPRCSYCDEDPPCDSCDPCRPPCEPCPPQPCCRPCCCCKITWVRSITTTPLKFIHPLILKQLEAGAHGCPHCSDPNVGVKALEAAMFESSDDIESVQTSQSRENANVNAGPRKQSSVLLTESEDVNVGSRHRKLVARKKCIDEETEKVLEKVIDSQYLTPRQRSDDCDIEVQSSCRCKPPDPWKRPPDMEQQTFERYVEEIVRTLEPAIPPNPFAVPRESLCINSEPDCERIRVELERLLAAVDDCPNSTRPCPSTPTVVRSDCWPC